MENEESAARPPVPRAFVVTSQIAFFVCPFPEGNSISIGTGRVEISRMMSRSVEEINGSLPEPSTVCQKERCKAKA